jgi:hypothetical protein
MPNSNMSWLAGLVVVALLFLGWRLWLKQRQQEEVQKSIRLSIERGMQLTPELIRGLGVLPPASDLKRGVIYICIAIGVALFGVLDSLEDGAQSSVLTFLAVAAFPALIGSVLIIFHYIDRGRR